MASAPAIVLNPTINQRLAGLTPAQRLRLVLGIALFVMVGGLGLFMGRQADWRVLYTNLADKDGGAIVAQLSQMNIPYKHAEGGGAILVPADKVHDTRLRLASLGLPKGSVAGFETMEANRFGMTQFQERLSFQRGLEGELTRSIQALTSVQNARVHLALPNQNGFFREQQKPSASVLISLSPGRSLDRSQLAGIIHLVSSSVPELAPGAVSVLDDSGKLLSTPPEGSSTAAGDAQQMQHVQQFEQTYSRRILEILEPVVGRNNARAQVTAEFDFSQTESTSELHKPNQSPDALAIRSQQVIESSNAANSLSSGVPGATSNQVPAAASAPVNGAAQTLSAGAGATGSVNPGSKRESITNYEVDKTVRVVRGGSGLVKRISAAVVVNHQSITDAKGKTTTTPLSPEQLDKLTALVRETIGFNQERGDSVNLLNTAFAQEKLSLPEPALWRQPAIQDLVHSFAWPVGTLIFSALLLFGIIRPAIQALSKATPRVNRMDPNFEAFESETPQLPQLAPPQVEPELLPSAPTPGDIALKNAKRLTLDNPAAVANIMKTWINAEAAA